MSKRKGLRAPLALLTALALALCLGGFAALAAKGGPIEAPNEDTPLTAAITNILKMPDGADDIYAGNTFEFVIAPVSVDGEGNEPTQAAMPKLGNSNAVTVTVNKAAAQGGSVADDVITVTTESGDLLDGVSFTHGGVYVYEITETPDTYEYENENYKESMDYSPAAYILTLWVTPKTAPSVGYYVMHMAVAVKTADNSGQEQGDKVNPTPGTGGGMTFTNVYFATQNSGGTPTPPTPPDPPDPPDPTNPGNQSLVAGAEISGGFGNEEVYFPFSFTVTEPALYTAKNNNTPGTYRAYVLDAGGDVVDGDLNVGVFSGTDDHGTYYTFTSGIDNELKLKHGQKLVFVGLPVGSEWTVTDTLGGDDPYREYIAEAEYTDNYGVKQTLTGTKGAELRVPASGSLLIVGGGSSVAFTNTRNATTPTGILMNDLPYIWLIALAVTLGGLSLFAADRLRRRREQDEARG